VGEPVAVTVRFREKRGVPVMNVDFVPIAYENFWVKQVGKRRRYAEGNYLVHEIRYLFFPQREGNLTIGPAKVKVAVTQKVRDAFGFVVRRPKWLTFESERIPLRVLPLPEGVTLVGRFSLDAEAAPLRVKAGEPVTLTVRVKAEGNIEDLRMPTPAIEGVTVYAQKPVVTQRYEHGRYSGEWVGRYTLLAERSFTIPSMTLDYFDTEKKRRVHLATPPIPVEVAPATALEEKRKTPEGTEKEKETMMSWLYMNLAAAFAAGMAVMWLLTRFFGKRAKRGRYRIEVPTERERMLQQLMPYISTSPEAAQMAENLYAAIYEGKAVKVEKKAFEALMRKLKGER
jgi:hypothetical protein